MCHILKYKSQVVLILCNIAKNDYQQDYTFVPNNLFG